MERSSWANPLREGASLICSNPCNSQYQGGNLGTYTIMMKIVEQNVHTHNNQDKQPPQSWFNIIKGNDYQDALLLCTRPPVQCAVTVVTLRSIGCICQLEGQYSAFKTLYYTVLGGQYSEHCITQYQAWEGSVFSIQNITLHSIGGSVLRIVHCTRVADLGSLSSGAKMAMKIFVKCIFTIFATNALFYA